jgi:hypothetical protein
MASAKRFAGSDARTSGISWTMRCTLIAPAPVGSKKDTLARQAERTEVDLRRAVVLLL